MTSGFYIGANGGWGSARNCWDLVAPAGTFIGAEGCHDATGGTAGGQVGYRWQAGAFVFGLEAQGNWADFKGSNGSLLPPAGLFTNETKIDAFGLFTGQVGYAWNNALLYVKGGAAVTANRFNQHLAPTGALVASSGDETRWGGVVGGGLEYGFAPNWSAAIEYDHIFMQDKTVTLATVPGGALFGNERVRQDVDMVTARIQLPLRCFGARQVLISSAQETTKPRHRSGLFLCRNESAGIGLNVNKPRSVPPQLR
jgi:outer membrane immunogenic protein